MRLIDLTPLHEIDFPNQRAFDSYNKVHKLRPDTKVVVAGRVTTAGRAAQNSPSPVKGTSVFGGDDKEKAVNKEKYPVGTKFFKPNGNQNIEVVRVEGDKILVSDIMPGKEWQWREDGIDDDIKNKKLQVKSDASLNGTSALNKPKSKDLVSSVENHLNKVSGGEGYAQTDDGSGAIVYNMGNGDMPTYTLYMGKEGNKHRVTLEPTYGNDPKKLQGKIDKSFDKVQDAIKFMGAVAKKYRKELEMDDNKKSTGDKPKQKLVFPDAKKKTVEEPFEGGENVLDTVEKLLPPGTGLTDKKTSNKILVKGYKDNHMFVSHENHPNKILKWPLKQFFKLASTKRFKFHPKSK